MKSLSERQPQAKGSGAPALSGGTRFPLSYCNVDFNVLSANSWSSPADGCPLKPSCDYYHGYSYVARWGHISPAVTIDDAVADVGMSTAEMTVCITKPRPQGL
jgi:hypothetical protein